MNSVSDSLWKDSLGPVLSQLSEDRSYSRYLAVSNALDEIMPGESRLGQVRIALLRNFTIESVVPVIAGDHPVLHGRRAEGMGHGLADREQHEQEGDECDENACHHRLTHRAAGLPTCLGQHEDRERHGHREKRKQVARAEVERDHQPQRPRHEQGRQQDALHVPLSLPGWRLRGRDTRRRAPTGGSRRPCR